MYLGDISGVSKPGIIVIRFLQPTAKQPRRRQGPFLPGAVEVGDFAIPVQKIQGRTSTSLAGSLLSPQAAPTGGVCL